MRACVSSAGRRFSGAAAGGTGYQCVERRNGRFRARTDDKGVLGTYDTAV